MKRITGGSVKTRSKRQRENQRLSAQRIAAAIDAINRLALRGPRINQHRGVPAASAAAAPDVDFDDDYDNYHPALAYDPIEFSRFSIVRTLPIEDSPELADAATHQNNFYIFLR